MHTDFCLPPKKVTYPIFVNHKSYDTWSTNLPNNATEYIGVYDYETTNMNLYYTSTLWEYNGGSSYNLQGQNIGECILCFTFL